MRKSHTGGRWSRKYTDGSAYRLDGRPVRLLVNGDDRRLVSMLNGRSIPVDAFQLAVLMSFGRLVPHRMATAPRRRRGGDRCGRGRNRS